MKTTVSQRIRSYGLRSTLPRQEVMRYLEVQSTPVSAHAVFSHIRAKGVDRSSVFRVLKLLNNQGLIERTENVRHEHLYELTPRQHHHHVHCEQCGMIKKVSCFLSSSRLSEIRRHSGFSVIHDTSDLYGICASCAQKNKESSL